MADAHPGRLFSFSLPPRCATGNLAFITLVQAEESVFLGLRDLRLDDFGARFDVRAGAGWLMMELSEGQVRFCTNIVLIPFVACPVSMN